jgi:hypothetical protein
MLVGRRCCAAGNIWAERQLRPTGCFSRVVLFQKKAGVAVLGLYSSRAASRGATWPSIKTTFLPGLGGRG